MIPLPKISPTIFYKELKEFNPQKDYNKVICFYIINNHLGNEKYFTCALCPFQKRDSFRNVAFCSVASNKIYSKESLLKELVRRFPSILLEE